MPDNSSNSDKHRHEHRHGVYVGITDGIRHNKQVETKGENGNEETDGKKICYRKQFMYKRMDLPTQFASTFKNCTNRPTTKVFSGRVILNPPIAQTIRYKNPAVRSSGLPLYFYTFASPSLRSLFLSHFLYPTLLQAHGNPHYAMLHCGCQELAHPHQQKGAAYKRSLHAACAKNKLPKAI